MVTTKKSVKTQRKAAKKAATKKQQVEQPQVEQPQVEQPADNKQNPLVEVLTELINGIESGKIKVIDPSEPAPVSNSLSIVTNRTRIGQIAFLSLESKQHENTIKFDTEVETLYCSANQDTDPLNVHIVYAIKQLADLYEIVGQELQKQIFDALQHIVAAQSLTLLMLSKTTE